MERSMEQSLMSHNLRAFELLRMAAQEYCGAEYKFYASGFFKFTRQDKTIFINDMYIIPEHRESPVASDILAAFTEFMRKEGFHYVYGNIAKKAPSYQKRMKKFTQDWGMEVLEENEIYSTVGILVKDLK